MTCLKTIEMRVRCLTLNNFTVIALVYCLLSTCSVSLVAGTGLQQSRKAQKSSGSRHIGSDREPMRLCLSSDKTRKSRLFHPRFPPASQCGWLGEEGGDIFRLAWLRYLLLPFQHLRAAGVQSGYMTSIPFPQAPDIVISENKIYTYKRRQVSLSIHAAKSHWICLLEQSLCVCVYV